MLIYKEARVKKFEYAVRAITIFEFGNYVIYCHGIALTSSLGGHLTNNPNLHSPYKEQKNSSDKSDKRNEKCTQIVDRLQ